MGLSLYAFSERVGDLSKPRPGEEWRLAGPQECAFNPHTTLLCLTCYCCAKSLQSCMTLCDAMDHSPLGSSVHGILQASILEWVAMTSSRGSSPPRDRTRVSYVSCIGRWVFFFNHLHHLGILFIYVLIICLALSSVVGLRLSSCSSGLSPSTACVISAGWL